MQVQKIIAEHFKQHQYELIVNYALCPSDKGQYHGAKILSPLLQQRALNFQQAEYYLVVPFIRLLKYQPVSRLLFAVQQCAEKLAHIAQQSDLEIAVADVSSTIVWTASTPLMQSKQRPLHFMLGAQWLEEAIGTNAFAQAKEKLKSVCVMGNEHQLSALRDWICYAAPIIDPISQTLIGIINLSIRSEQHNVLGTLAVEQCAIMIENEIRDQRQHCLKIDTRSEIKIFLNNEALQITPQQKEIICILAMHPQGIELNQLHHALYGERKTRIDTLKAEMGKIKRILRGCIKPRSYQLLLHVEADFLKIEHALDSGQIQHAQQLYQHNCLANVRSPVLAAWRSCLISRFTTTLQQKKSQPWAEQQYC